MENFLVITIFTTKERQEDTYTMSDGIVDMSNFSSLTFIRHNVFKLMSAKKYHMIKLMYS